MPNFKKQTIKKKVSFYLDEDLYLIYKDNKHRAKGLNLTIDYHNDFRKWFREQLLLAKEEIDIREKKRQSNKEDGPAGKTADGHWKKYVKEKKK